MLGKRLADRMVELLELGQMLDERLVKLEIIHSQLPSPDECLGCS